MHRSNRLLLTSVLIGLLFFLGLSYWYQWSARPLTQAEVDDYIARIEAQTQDPGGRHDIPALRRFLEADDGNPFYTINLFKYYEQAQYPAGPSFEGDGAAAFARYGRVMLWLQIKHASHPIFGSNWVSYDNNDWDRVIITRYRSRRDIVDIFASDAFADAALHKWAAVEDNTRILAEATLLPGGTSLTLILSLFVTLLSYLVGGSAGRMLALRRRTEGRLRGESTRILLM